MNDEIEKLLARLDASPGWRRLSQRVLNERSQLRDQAPILQNVRATVVELDDEARTNIATIRAIQRELRSDAEAVRWALKVAVEKE